MRAHSPSSILKSEFAQSAQVYESRCGVDGEMATSPSFASSPTGSLLEWDELAVHGFFVNTLNLQQYEDLVYGEFGTLVCPHRLSVERCGTFPVADFR